MHYGKGTIIFSWFKPPSMIIHQFIMTYISSLLGCVCTTLVAVSGGTDACAGCMTTPLGPGTPPKKIQNEIPY